MTLEELTAAIRRVYPDFIRPAELDDFLRPVKEAVKELSEVGLIGLPANLPSKDVAAIETACRVRDRLNSLLTDTPNEEESKDD